MISETVTFEDAFGEKQTETLYFHLNKMDIMDMARDNWPDKFKAFTKFKDFRSLLDLTIDLMCRAYGERRVDESGHAKFVRNTQMAKEFRRSDECAAMVDRFLDNPESVNDFIEKIIPNNIAEAARKEAKEKTGKDVSEMTEDEIRSYIQSMRPSK